MNILFLTLTPISTISQRGIYTDLMRQLAKRHNIYTITTDGVLQNDEKLDTLTEGNVTILRCRIKSFRREKSLFKKGINTLLFGQRLKKQLKKRLTHTHFDMIVYATPPITLNKVVSYFKKRDNAETYLLLKDIFPQNSVDIGMLSKSGIKGLLYKFFRRQEKRLYALSDKIGCMSKANVEYLLKHNPAISKSKVEVFPNCIEMTDKRISSDERESIRKKYNIPLDKKVFIYGGNLGKPQGIPFILSCLNILTNHPKAYILIVGDGTEFYKLKQFFDEKSPKNMMLIPKLPRDDYDALVAAGDVGLIFLDYRFTIPNFPSRLLSYMQAGIPVLACTDPNTDIGTVIVDGGFGWKCESNDEHEFAEVVDKCCEISLKQFGERSFEYLKEHYTAEKNADKIS